MPPVDIERRHPYNVSRLKAKINHKAAGYVSTEHGWWPFRFAPLQLTKMWFPDLSGISVNNETALVLLTWHELFDEKTPDTYRARLHDSLSLFTELRDIAERAESDNRWQSHLHHVIEELHDAGSSDLILKQGYPHIRRAIVDDLKNLSSARMRRFADTAIHELQTYEQKVVENLLSAVANLPKEKEKTISGLQMLATRAVQRGLTFKECRGVVNESHFEIEPPKAVEELVKTLTPTKKNWTCIVAISGEEKALDKLLPSTNFRRLPSRRKPLGQIGKTFQENVKDKILIFSEVEADLLNDAVQKSLHPLRLILDVANFNHRGAPFYLLPWVYLEAGRTQHLLNRNEESGLQPQRQAIEKANELQVKGIIGKLPEGIVSALEQYSVAHSSTDLKTRFLNIWVALETLVGQEPGSNIADSIVRSILPHIIHRRVSKIVTYLSICLHEWGFCRTVPDPTGHFSRSKKGRINPGELLLLLCRDDLEEVRKALGSLINTHPLLLNHLFTVHKALIKPKELLKQLNQSAKRTEWQFRRIYRARNLLVHAGSSVRSLMYLAANLEYYFSLTLSRIFHDFHRYEEWSVEKSFERRRLLYEYFLYQLENIPQEITVADLLIQPDEGLSATALWH